MHLWRLAHCSPAVIVTLAVADLAECIEVHVVQDDGWGCKRGCFCALLGFLNLQSFHANHDMFLK